MANTFGWLFIKRFSRLLSYLNGIRSNFLMLISLLIWAGLEEFAAYNIGMITGTFYKVLGDKDKNGFYRQLTQSILLIIGIAIVKSVKDLTANHLYLGWRNKLTHWIHSLYFTDILYYNINVIDNQIDNPDQRITQDVEKMCNKLSTVIPTLILFPFVLVFYTYTSYNKVGWIGPVGCFGFFIVASTITKLFMNPIVGLVYEQEKREGFFRYQHMHVR